MFHVNLMYAFQVCFSSRIEELLGRNWERAQRRFPTHIIIRLRYAKSSASAEGIRTKKIDNAIPNTDTDIKKARTKLGCLMSAEFIGLFHSNQAFQLR